MTLVLGKVGAWLGRNPLFASIAALLVLAVLWWTSCRVQPTPIPPREKTSIDSLMATKPAFDSARVATVKVESVYVTRSAVSSRQAGHAAQQADSLRAIANVLQRAAEAQRDTSSRWYAVATARGEEAESLRVANGGLVTALADQVAATAAADQRALITTARLTASDNLTQRLARDVATANQCRLLVVIACPSRKAAAIGGVLLGATGAILMSRRLIP